LDVLGHEDDITYWLHPWAVTNLGVTKEVYNPPSAFTAGVFFFCKSSV
jgi:hypothetical protein